MIARKWKLEKMDSPFQDSMLAKMDSIGKVENELGMKQAIETSSTTFFKDGKFNDDFGFAKVEGTFRISDDGKKLLLKPTKETAEESLEIVELTDNKLVVSQTDNNHVSIVNTYSAAKE